MLNISSKLILICAGPGLRRALLGSLEFNKDMMSDFYEVEPENWIKIGGQFEHHFETLAEHTSLIAYGLSLSLGGTYPLYFYLF